MGCAGLGVAMEEWLLMGDIRCAELAEKLMTFGVESPADLLLLDREDVEELVRDVKRIPKKKFCTALQALRAEAALQKLRAEEAALQALKTEASALDAEVSEPKALAYEVMLASDDISPVHRATLEKMAQRRKQREAKQRAERAAALAHAAMVSAAARLNRLDHSLQGEQGLQSSNVDKAPDSSSDDDEFHDVQQLEPETTEESQLKPDPDPEPQPWVEPEPQLQLQPELEPEAEAGASPPNRSQNDED